MTPLDFQGTSVSDVALALWAENSAISLKLRRTLKQRHQSLPHVAKHSRLPLSPWSTTMTTCQQVESASTIVTMAYDPVGPRNSKNQRLDGPVHIGRRLRVLDNPCPPR